MAKPEQWIIDLISEMGDDYIQKVSPCGTKLYAFYKKPYSEPHFVKDSNYSGWETYPSPPEWSLSVPWWNTTSYEFSEDEMALAEALINS